MAVKRKDKCMEHLYQRAVEYDADVVQFQMKVVREVTDASCLDIKKRL